MKKTIDLPRDRGKIAGIHFLAQIGSYPFGVDKPYSKYLNRVPCGDYLTKLGLIGLPAWKPHGGIGDLLRSQYQQDDHKEGDSGRKHLNKIAGPEQLPEHGYGGKNVHGHKSHELGPFDKASAACKVDRSEKQIEDRDHIGDHNKRCPDIACFRRNSVYTFMDGVCKKYNEKNRVGRRDQKLKPCRAEAEPCSGVGQDKEKIQKAGSVSQYKIGICGEHDDSIIPPFHGEEGFIAVRDDVKNGCKKGNDRQRDKEGIGKTLRGPAHEGRI